MEITFTRSHKREPPSLALRSDGVTVSIPMFGPLGPIPHDLAHYIVEREMGLGDGFWGSVAAGAVFGGMHIVSGRQRPHAGDRSNAVKAANRPAIILAEQMVSALMDVMEGREPRQPPLSSHAQTPKSLVAFRALVERLTPAVREMVDRWERLPVGGTLVVQWPETQPRGTSKRSRST